MKHVLLILFSLISFQIHAQPSQFIHVDQFGYFPQSNKVAVISNPQIGYNSDENYNPGSTLELIDVENNEAVFEGAISIWNDAVIHQQSGDNGWWFDFSSFNTEGTYLVRDPSTGEESAQFDIGNNIYNAVLNDAFKAFYYNRCNTTKETPFAESNWTDETNFLNSLQDANCRFIYDRNDASLEKELSGGWFDAGDYNKYVTFAHGTIHDLLWAYEENSALFGDKMNIPESGNGISDLLDEIKWELDWLIKMTNEDGTVHNKMGSQNHSENISAPPSANTDQRFYGPTCTSSSVAIASMFAHAAKVYKEVPSMESYANQLQDIAEKCWDFAKGRYDSSSLELDCDDGSIISGDADWDASLQYQNLITAGIYLYELTGNETYIAFLIDGYASLEQIASAFWGPYQMPLNDALLLYSTFDNANADVGEAIINSITVDAINNNNGYWGISDADLYRAPIPDWSYHWGSNMPKAHYGNLNQLLINYNLNPANEDSYSSYVLESCHYFHGVNPQGMVYLSNMYDRGGDRCANEIYHTWFADGSDWDNALTSEFGPAPGFVVGGPNSSFSVNTLTPPYDQPSQKSYLDFNDGWPESSWEITEPAIYYQAAYLRLLANAISQSNQTISDTHILAQSESIEIFPNPTNHIFNVRGVLGLYNIDILDVNGSVIMNKNTNNGEVSVDINELGSGTYLIRVSNKNNEVLSVQKIIKI